MDVIEFETKKFEYRMAQQMLRHYDTLNWLIGTILIAAVLMLTGLVTDGNLIGLAKQNGNIRCAVSAGIPALSLFVLGTWLLWFRRHRALYNFRNEVIHRLELQLGMYHYLRVAESDLAGDAFEQARVNAGHDSLHFKPLYPLALSGPSGYTLAKVLTFGLPLMQLLLFCALFNA